MLPDTKQYLGETYSQFYRTDIQLSNKWLTCTGIYNTKTANVVSALGKISFSYIIAQSILKHPGWLSDRNSPALWDIVLDYMYMIYGRVKIIAKLKY